MQHTNSKHIVVVGGGFAGIELLKRMRKSTQYHFTLVDINNYNFFPPLLYQVATGFMEPSSISYPYRRILRGVRNARFRMAELQSIDVERKILTLNNGELSYDILVLSTGAVTNFFGNERLEQQAIPMKTIADALSMRNYLLSGLEKASRSSDLEERAKLLTTVVAGAGPTGVELAGMFAEMRKNIIGKDYPELRSTPLGEIILVDGSDAVLSPMSTKAQQYTYKMLSEMGVEIVLNTLVKDYKNDVVYLSNGREIATKNLIWSAGVAAQMFTGLSESTYGPGKRMRVNEHNELLAHADVFALGDTAFSTYDPAFPNGHPQVAQVALQQAQQLSENLKKGFIGQSNWQAFRYKDKGSMAIIGRNKAVADLPKPKLFFKGFPAWFIWVFIHIMSLVNYKNKVRTFNNWVWAYFSKDQSFRMMIKSRY